MKTIKIIKGYYTFDELQKEQKETVLENFRDYFTKDFDFFQEDIINNYVLNNKYLSEIKPKYFYSGFYSQGDGGRFEFNYLNSELLLKMLKEFYKSTSKEYKKLYNFIKKYDFVIDYKLNSYSNHYYHSNTFYFSCGSDDKLLNDYCENLREYFKKLSDELYLNLQKEYGYLSTDKYIINEFKEREFLFNIENLNDYIIEN